MELIQPRRRFLFVTWDGGGNLPPAIGLARESVAIGHSARFLGHRKQRAYVEAAGLSFHAFEQTPDYDADVPIAPEDFAPFLFDHIIFEPLMAADVGAELDREPVDGVIVDCMLTAPLALVESRAVPMAVLVHTLHSFFDDWELASIPGSPRLASLRSSLGLASVTSLQATWLAADRVLVVSPPEFDPPRGGLPANTIHVGPVVDRHQVQTSWSAAWGPQTNEPLVLVSFSTTAMEQEALLNRVGDALSMLPVRVMITTGTGIDRGSLRPGPNATVCDFVPHEAVLPYVDLAICHAGHGTVMAALAHGVPLLCLPMGRDQPMVAARVEAFGAGRSLGPDSDAATIRRTAAALLDDPGVRDGARYMASLIARRRGGVVAAEQLLAMLPSTPTPRSHAV